MNLTKKIAHNTLIQISGKVISTVLGLLAIAMLTRYLGVEKFGWYITAIGVLQFVAVLADFGFTPVTSSLLTDPKYNPKQVLNNIFTLRLLTGLFFNGLAAAIIFLFPYRIEIKLAVVILSLSFFFVSLNQVFWGYYQKKLAVLVPVTGEILSRLALVILFYFFIKGQTSFLWIMVAITMAAGVMTVYLWSKSNGIKFYLNKKLTLKIIAYMWPLAVAIIFNAIYLHGDKVLLPLFVDQIQVGLYGAAYRVVEIIIQLMGLTAGILMPLVAYSFNTDNRQEFKKRVQLFFDTMSLVFLPMVAGLMALAKPIMLLVAGSDFKGSIPVLQLLTFVIIGILFGSTFSSIAVAIKQQRKTLWLYVGVAIISLTAYFIMIPKFGIWGAAIVSVGAELLAGLGLFCLTCYLAKFFPCFKNFFKILFASTIMGYLVWITPTPHLVVSIFLGIVIFAILAFILKIISKENLQEVLTNKK